MVAGEVGEGVREVMGSANARSQNKASVQETKEDEQGGSGRGKKSVKLTSDVVLPELTCSEIVLSNVAVDGAGKEGVVGEDDGGDGVLGFGEGLNGGAHLGSANRRKGVGLSERFNEDRKTRRRSDESGRCDVLHVPKV